MNVNKNWLMARMALMAWAVGPAVAAAERVDFATQIQPVFVEHCGNCHGESKQLGRLQLTTVAGIQAKLAAEPQLLVAGKPDTSELLQRLLLPEDDRKRMPKQAEPLTAETIAMIRAWIEQGADLAVATAEHQIADTPLAPSDDPQALPQVPAASAEALARLEADGAYVMPLYQGSPLLVVSYALRAEPAGDAQLRLLQGVAEQLFSLNLKGAQATEAGYAALTQFPHLRRLHLELSSITDQGLQHIAGLDALEYLNLYGTQISDAGLQHLSDLRQLRNLYLWQTRVSYNAATALADKIDQLNVDLGHDHPVIVQQRLTAEMDSVTKQLNDTRAEEENAQRQLDAARKHRESLELRLQELEASRRQLAEPSTDQAQNRPEAQEGKP